MKNFIYTAFLVVMGLNLEAQVVIGKTTVSNPSVLLEFDDAENNTKGIILSAVANLNNVLGNNPAANNGTFLFDKTDDRVKMYEDGIWVNLSDPGSETKIVPNTSDENNPNQGAIIGARSTNAKGVLVLESPNKAMVLPWIQNPHLNVKEPYPGMICYDTASRTLAVFDGVVWSYWK